MQKDTLSSAIAGIAAQIAAALVAGHDTRDLRHELSALEQRRRREAAEAVAEERARRAAAEAEEQAQNDARAAELVAAAEDRVRERLAALDAPAAPRIRRTPQGVHIIAKVNDE